MPTGRDGPPTPAEVAAAFARKVARDAPDACWLWTGTILDSGYGQAWDGARKQRAHRLAWVLAHGEIPPGKLVCHHCDTPACANPAHLFLGTNADNRADAVAKGRAHGPKRWPHNSRSKLTDPKDVAAILADARAHATIALDYKVSQTTISKLKRDHETLVRRHNHTQERHDHGTSEG